MHRFIPFFLFFVFCLLDYNCLYAQSTPYKLRYAKEDYSTIFLTQKTDTVNLYIIDHHDMDSLLHYSPKPYKMVLFYAFWCSASMKKIPSILAYAGDSLDIFLVATDDYTADRQFYTNRIANYIKQFSSNSFILDVSIIKGERRDFKRKRLFINALCPPCEAKKMGYSSFFVYDNKNQVVLHTDYTQSIDFVIENLKK